MSDDNDAGFTERGAEVRERVRQQRAELVAGSEVAPIIPRTVEEVGRVADAVITAGMVPKSYEALDQKGTKAKLMIGIMKGLEVGFGPITALSTICVINNRPCLWGDGAVALCQRAGAVESVHQGYDGEEGADSWTAYYTIKRRGQTNPYTGTFSVKDAKRAHLWGNPKRTPWIEYPQRMLMARARAFGLREGFADFLMGLSIAEEIQDLPQEPPAKADTSFLDALPAPSEEPLDDHLGDNLARDRSAVPVDRGHLSGDEPEGDGRSAEGN